MEWDARNPSQWDWDSMALLSGKVNEISKSAQQLEWRVEGSREIANGAVYPSGGATGSVSELGNGCSSKSSISASIDSFSKAGFRKSEITFEAIEGLSKNHKRSKELARVEDTVTSPVVVDMVCPKEPVIGLKLGKRTYFEDVYAGNSTKSSSPSVTVTPSPALIKKPRVSHQAVQNPHCQVEGCNMDLTTAKDYHRKHRVCENHSKSPKVIVAGQERRFCQQCSRFHELSEFDQKKRSCRRRLSDHNARRRKPQPDTISFSPRTSLSFYEDRQQMNFLWNRSPWGHVRSNASSTWEGLCDFKLTQTRGSWIKPTKAEGIGGQLHLPSTVRSNNVSTPRHDLDRLLPFKGTAAKVLNQGLEASAVASTLDGAPDFRRALSLLSTDSWGSTDPRPTSIINFANTIQNGAAHSAVHAENTTSGYWQEEQPLAQQARVLSFDLHGSGSQFQVLKGPFETAFFDSSQIH